VAERDDDDKTRADDYLKKALAGGPRRTNDVEEESKGAHTISKRTLERARTRLGIAAAQRASGPEGKDGKRRSEWWIALPEHAGDLKEVYKAPDNSDQTANANDALTSPDRQTANTAKPPGGLAEWRSGGLVWARPVRAGPRGLAAAGAI